MKRCYYIGLCAAIILIGTGLWYWHSLQPKRVHREHTKTVPKQFEYLTRRIDFSFSGDARLSRKEAENDLDELEWLLENRYSYLKRRGIDYRSALDTIRSSLGEGISRGAFALQLMKFLALLGPYGRKCGKSKKIGKSRTFHDCVSCTAKREFALSSIDPHPIGVVAQLRGENG